MGRSSDLVTEQLPQVTVADVRRFSRAVDIHDADAFAAELQAFVRERLEGIGRAARQRDGEAAAGKTLQRKASQQRAAERWQPAETDIQRGRAAMLAVYDQPCNLSVPRFAALAGKSRQQVYKDLEAGRLFALDIGRRGRRLPDWQLDPVRQELVRQLLQATRTEVDVWTLHDAMTLPLESLSGQPPIEAVTPDSVTRVRLAVLDALGIH